ncbi:hypothetical protein EMIHUDRAFT_437742 [Emiliania huxleyi CCMP1516]|uniref:Uncharacterized protein n=2 Tax=Emiliania huxleyi TaxID=2903 RepID=A0A0D3II24_EMIH1|nr:hypothetical protein EMIHUDRAFT_437742 [Emiliania huxleyi CCMP1516]EOD10909.1 hypothetical protein EMIHUDRAFT_437742 [Emiliania huxleyi CCMP1516]|eukprot:XP_005763338.1 hypothetical protein EMIHUDRAFT_437742 [Emiliania huxleyi CCMP1516]
MLAALAPTHPSVLHAEKIAARKKLEEHVQISAAKSLGKARRDAYRRGGKDRGPLMGCDAVWATEYRRRVAAAAAALEKRQADCRALRATPTGELEALFGEAVLQRDAARHEYVTLLAAAMSEHRERRIEERLHALREDLASLVPASCTPLTPPPEAATVPEEIGGARGGDGAAEESVGAQDLDAASPSAADPSAQLAPALPVASVAVGRRLTLALRLEAILGPGHGGGEGGGGGGVGGEGEGEGKGKGEGEGEGKGEGEAAAVDSPAPSGLLPSLEAWAAEQPRYEEELAFLRPHAGGKYPSLAPLHAAKEAWEGAADALVLARSATKLRKPPPGAAEKAEEALASVQEAAAALRAERAALDEVAELHFPELPLRIRAAGFDVSEEEIAEAFGAEGL